MENDFCEICGAKLLARWERVSPLLVHCLIKLYDHIVLTGKNEVSISKELNLTKTEYNNFQKLRFHGLIAKVELKPGYWLLTSRGSDFLYGKIQIPSKVKIFRNLIQERDSVLLSVKDIVGTIPYVDQKDDFVYEQASLTAPN